MSCALYEIAKNPDVQAKLRSEIAEQMKQKHGQIDYDDLPKMGYLKKCLLGEFYTAPLCDT